MSLTRSVHGTHLAVSWLTVLPIPQPRVEIDRPVAARAIAATPVVGVLLGGVAAGLAAVLALSQLPSIVVGALVVAALGLLTRGMHIDGLADTVDGLGCYGPPERAREVMHSGGVGPFGAAALLVVLRVQAAGGRSLADSHEWWSIVVAVTLGRVAVLTACRRGLSAAANGFGALVADSQRWSIVVWTVLALIGAAVVDIDVWWRGLIVVGVITAGAWVVSAHCARRFGGINGDVLGAVLELGTTVAVVGFLI